MATPITDPSTLAYLNRDGVKPPASGPKPITDPGLLGHLEYGIDFAQPVEHVRDAIGKLPESRRAAAINHWADAFVAREREQGGVGQTVDNAARTLARGTFAGPWLDEITAATAGGLHAATGGAVGAPYEETLAYQRAKDRAVDKANPVLSTVGKVAGGIASGVAAMRVPGVAGTVIGGPFMRAAPAASVGGRVAQTAGVGALYGANAGAGEAEGGLSQRAEGAALGGAVGAALGGGLGVAGELATAGRRLWAGQGQSGAYQRAAEGLTEAPSGTTAVDHFADQLATGAQNGNPAIRRRALDILGEEMERAGGDRAVAIPAAVQRISREAGVSPQTANQHLRDLNAMHADSPLMFAEAQTVAASDAAMRGPNGGRVSPRNADLDALGRVQESPLANQLDYLANNGNMPSATVARNRIRERQETLRPAFEAAVEGMPGAPRVATGQRATRAADIADTAQMIENATQLAQNSYHAAYSGPTDQRALTSWLPRLLNRFEQMASGRSGEYADAMRRAADQFYVAGRAAPSGASGAPGSPMGRQVMTSLRQLQDARTAIRGQMEGYRAQGRRDLANVVQPIYQNVTRLMEHANPVWGRANRQWGDMNFLRMGQELGDAFAQKAGPRYREQLQEFRQLAPQAQDIVRVHFLQKIKDRLDNAGDTHALSKFFANDHSRTMVRQLFGDEAAVSFTRAVRNQRSAEETQAMLANSKTHRRGQTQKQMDTESGLIAAVQSASPSEAKSTVLQWMAQRANELRNRPLADILTTPMTDTAAVARHVHNMRRQAERVQRLQQPAQWPMNAAGIAGSAAGRQLAPQGLSSPAPKY